MNTEEQIKALPGSITKLLLEWNQGDEDALNEVVALIYDDLRCTARRYLYSGTAATPTLSPTELINEVYLRLRDNKSFQFKNRTQFFWLAGKLMRHIVVDHARIRLAQKRGAGEIGLPLELATDFAEREDLDLPILIALGQALHRLERLDSRKGQIVELRFFAGLKFQEIAEVLNISLTTVKREWDMAKRWLARELEGDRLGGSI